MNQSQNESGSDENDDVSNFDDLEDEEELIEKNLYKIQKKHDKK